MVGFRLTLAQHFKVFLSLRLDFDGIMAHKLRIYWSSSSTFANCLPRCFLDFSIRAKNSSSVKRVGSFFCATSLRRYLATRVSKSASSAIAPRLRSISAFNAPFVLLSYCCLFYVSATNLGIISEKQEKN